MLPLNIIYVRCRYYWYLEERDENRRLSRLVTTLRSNVRDLSRQITRLSNESSGLSSQVSTLRGRAWALESEKTRMLNENRELQSQVSTLSGELAKQREDTRKAGLLFMDAADAYQQAARKQIKAKVEESEGARKAGMLIMDAADAYQDVAKKRTMAKEEELEDMRKAILVVMTAADAYQQEAKKQIKEMVEELKSLGAQKAEMDGRAESLEAKLDAALHKNREMEVDRDKVKVENGNLRSEVERLTMELGKLAEVGEEAAKAFDVEEIENTNELENPTMKIDKTQARRDLAKIKNDVLSSEVLIADQMIETDF
jgi:chromosome segregation ATPase